MTDARYGRVSEDSRMIPGVFLKEAAATGLTAFTDSLELYEEKDLKAHIRKLFKVTEEESLERTTGRAPY
jgi:hypothetical protein